MKILDIAQKDMRQSFRSKSALIFMFVVPILITVLFFFMFGGIAGGDDDEFALAAVPLIIVNQDQGQVTEFGSMGDFLSSTLQEDAFGEIMRVSQMDDLAAARSAVDNQEAAVALIIPQDFTAAIIGQGPDTAVELYKDPTLTIGPAIVSSIVGQIVDGMAAGNFGINATLAQMQSAGVEINQELIQDLVDRMAAGAQEQQGSGLTQLLPPSGQEEGNELTQLLALILGGMMVFYAFFTGANVLNTILTEQENGTLQRLFTTPTSHLTLFSGKFVAALIILLVQISVLLLFGRFVFNIQWGQPLPVAIAAAGLILIAATFGLFLVSLLKDQRQAGLIFGGLLTMTGMIGLISVFTAASPNTPPLLDTLSLLAPQGWAMRTFRQAMDSQALTDILITFAVILILSAIFFIIGQRRLQKRFL